MRKLFRHLISKLYYKYCYSQDKLALHIIAYYVPCIMKDGSPVTGTYLFGIINENIKQGDKDVWTQPAGLKKGIVQPLASVNLNVEKFGEEE